MKNKLTRQQVALKNPYSSPLEFNPDIKKIVHLANLRVSSVLCVDAFTSEPVWHTSGAILDLKMMPKSLFGEVSAAELKILSDHLSGLISRVGEGEMWTHQSDKILHFYKKLSVDELSKIKKRSGQKPEDFYSAGDEITLDNKTMKIPENMILRLKEDKEISTAAKLEAEMSYMKMREPNPKNTDVIYMYPELIHSKEDLFLFAMTYGMHLNGLNEGLRQVNAEVRKIFDAKNN